MQNTLANDLFRNSGLQSVLNNQNVVTEVDILINNHIKVDVQFSNNYKRYGDFRVDLVSAFYTGRMEGQPFSAEELLRDFEEKNNLTIIQPGKIYQEGYLDYLIVFFYNHVGKVNISPDYTLIIKKDYLIQYINKNAKTLINNIKINNKNHLQDQHGSAFIPINTSNFSNAGESNVLLVQGTPSSEEIRSIIK